MLEREWKWYNRTPTKDKSAPPQSIVNTPPTGRLVPTKLNEVGIVWQATLRVDCKSSLDDGATKQSWLIAMD